MKFSTSKNELQQALQKLSKATPTRSTLPILSCVLITASNDKTTLRTTDLELTIDLEISVSIEEEGSAAVPLKQLYDITNELPETRITIIADIKNKIEPDISEEISYSSNIIKDVYYSSKDIRGNEYVIKASEGEIDYNNSNIIYLTNLEGFVKLANSNDIKITSKYGKYNTENFDTIFSKNVIIVYLDGKITGEYLDFSIKRNSMIISRNIIYTNLENILEADVMEINIETKDSKIFMYEDNKKVKIKSIN